MKEQYPICIFDEKLDASTIPAFWRGDYGSLLYKMYQQGMVYSPDISKNFKAVERTAGYDKYGNIIVFYTLSVNGNNCTLKKLRTQSLNADCFKLYDGCLFEHENNSTFSLRHIDPSIIGDTYGNPENYISRFSVPFEMLKTNFFAQGKFAFLGWHNSRNLFCPSVFFVGIIGVYKKEECPYKWFYQYEKIYKIPVPNDLYGLDSIPQSDIFFNVSPNYFFIRLGHKDRGSFLCVNAHTGTFSYFVLPFGEFHNIFDCNEKFLISLRNKAGNLLLYTFDLLTSQLNFLYQFSKKASNTGLVNSHQILTWCYAPSFAEIVSIIPNEHFVFLGNYLPSVLVHIVVEYLSLKGSILDEKSIITNQEKIPSLTENETISKKNVMHDTFDQFQKDTWVPERDIQKQLILSHIQHSLSNDLWDYCRNDFTHHALRAGTISRAIQSANRLEDIKQILENQESILDNTKLFVSAPPRLFGNGQFIGCFGFFSQSTFDRFCKRETLVNKLDPSNLKKSRYYCVIFNNLQRLNQQMMYLQNPQDPVITGDQKNISISKPSTISINP